MIDKVKITVKSGKGGDGSASFRREKFVPKGGPDGGDGGNGGSVYLTADLHHNTLSHFRGVAEFAAQSGNPGLGAKKFGLKGADREVAVPLGTIIWEESESGEKVRLGEIVHADDRLLVARGGRGGRGNVHFKSSRNTTPLEFELGGEAQVRVLSLELKLLADIGLVGFPNAGKSTLLSVLTKATPKIADYPFTTLDPNLGVMMMHDEAELASYVLADIPGLIEQASQGKGLGYEFLRHIERCRLLLFVLFVEERWLSLVETQPEAAATHIAEQWRILRNELAAYDPKLAERPYLVAINKIDLWAAAQPKLATALAKLLPKGQAVIFISAAAGTGLMELRQQLHRRIKTLPPPTIEETIPIYAPEPEAGKPRLVRKEKP